MAAETATTNYDCDLAIHLILFDIIVGTDLPKYVSQCKPKSGNAAMRIMRIHNSNIHFRNQYKLY